VSNETAKTEISEWLGEIAPDERVAGLLGLCVGRLLLREGLHWRQKAMAHRLDITHIADWLSAAVAEGAQWLSREDELGRPKKLMKFGGFREMVTEADKAMALAIQKRGTITVDPAHERIVAHLSDGYAMVEMLSETALDRESAEMQHCIGNGGYDGDVRGEFIRLLSLRDPHGKPHATFRVNRLSSIVVEYQGKQNQPPHPKYMGYIREFIKAEGLRFSHGGENRIGMVEDIYGEWHDLADLPDELETAGSLNMRDVPQCRIPRRLVVNGDFTAPHWMDETPQVLHVAGDLFSGALPRFVGDFRAGRIRIAGGVNTSRPGFRIPERIDAGTVVIETAGLIKLPRKLEVTGNLALSIPSATGVPEELKVGGLLDIERTGLKVWKGDVDCGGMIVQPRNPFSFQGAVRVRGDLTVKGSDVTFAKELRVSGNADFSENGAGRKIAALPGRMFVSGNLLLDNCTIGKMPRHLEVGGELVLTDAKFPSLAGLKRVGGTMRIEGTAVTALPENLVKMGGLMAAKSLLASLPEGFTVKDNLILIGTPMEELPGGLFVGGNLFVQTSGISILPEDAVVKGRIIGISGLRDVIDRSKGGRPQVRSLRL
jgi:hypothetical protein